MFLANLFLAMFMWTLTFIAIAPNEENLSMVEDVGMGGYLFCCAIVIFSTTVATFNVIHFWNCQ